MAVDVESGTGQAGPSGLAQQPRRQLGSIREHDGLDTVLRNERHDLHDLRMNQRLAADNRDVVWLAPTVEEANLLPNLLQWLMSRQSLAIASLAVQIAEVTDLQPRDGIIVLGSRKPIPRAFLQSHITLH